LRSDDKNFWAAKIGIGIGRNFSYRTSKFMGNLTSPPSPISRRRKLPSRGKKTTRRRKLPSRGKSIINV